MALIIPPGYKMAILISGNRGIIKDTPVLHIKINVVRRPNPDPSKGDIVTMRNGIKYNEGSWYLY